MKIKLFLFLFVLVFIGQNGVLAQTQTTVKGLSGRTESSSFFFSVHPSLRGGTHINEFGLSLRPGLRLPLGERAEWQLAYQLMLRFNSTYLGIPGLSFTAVNQLSSTLAWGTSRPNPAWISGGPHQVRTHQWQYYYLDYASTDGTSQRSGGLLYRVLGEKFSLQLQLENDFLAFQQRDAFRTGAGTLDVRWKSKNYWWGLGVGHLLWTGTTTGLPFLDFGEEYDMSQQYGADYSHGLAFINLHIQAFTLSLGYDSDQIRRNLQDPIHRLIDDGTIPAGRLSKSRLFCQLSWNALAWIY